MATFTVTETNDNVDGSLRDAIARANTRPGPDVIVFDSSLSGQTISLTGPRLNIGGDLTINGLGADALTIDGNGNDIFGIPARVANIAVTLTGLTLTDADDAIQINGNANTVTLTDSRVADARVKIDPATGEDDTGDGLRVEGDRNRLTVRDSIFERNGDNIDFAGPTTANPNREPAEDNIVEITNSTIRFAREDGLVVNGHSNTVTVQNSTVNGNGRLSVEDPNDGIDVNGNDNALNIRQVTISSNGEHGLDIEGNGIRVALEISTITNNISDGVIIQDHINRAATTSTVFVENSIIAGNRGERSSALVGGADVFDPFASNNFISAGHNLIGNGTGSREFDNPDERGPGDLVGIRGNPIDARLGPLEANGGPTATHALLSGSPAIDAGDPNFTPPPEFDQRGPGFPRILDGRIDIGAVESNLAGSRVDSIFVREAGEDGDDLNAEWRMFFRSQDSVVASLREDNVHDADRHAVEPGDFAFARGDGNTLRFSAGGFENDVRGDRPTENNDRLPGIEVEIQPFDVGGGFPIRGAEFGYTLTMGVSGRLDETGTAAAPRVNRSDFAYEVTWRVESGGSGQPVEVTVDRLHIVEAEPGESDGEWNPTFVAGTVGSLRSFTPLEDTVRDGQDFDFAGESPERTLGVNPAGNDVLILRAGGFERDNNLPDMLPIGEVVIRPADDGFGLAMAVDGGEFAYEVNWRINPVSGELLVEEELDSFPVLAGQGENLGLLAEDEMGRFESILPSEPAPPPEPEPFAIPLLGVASDADVFV